MEKFKDAWTRKRIGWTIAGLVTILLNIVLRANPVFCEEVYGKGVFPAVRLVFGHTTGYLPIPAITLVAVLALLLLVKTAFVPLFRRKASFWSFLAGLCSTAGALVFFFQFLWGFNYHRITLERRMELSSLKMTPDDLRAEFKRATDVVREDAYTTGTIAPINLWPRDTFERVVTPLVETALRTIDWPLSTPPRGRIIRPKGLLMRWNTAGIYVPFSGEGHVDDGMLPVQKPYTLAHEMSHGFGVTDEADANFVAYLACRASDDPLVRFAGNFTYWRYVAGEYRYAFPDAYAEQFQTLPVLLRETLAEIYRNDAKYPDLLPDVRNAVYDSYLKSQGVADGLRSYNRVVRLVWAFEQKNQY